MSLAAYASRFAFAAVLTAAAGAAWAGDPIGEALESPPHPAETAVATAPPTPAALPPAAAPAPAPAPAQAPVATAPDGSTPPPPVTTSGDPGAAETGEVSQDGPPNETALAYEARIRASVAAAQSLQGPLDGRWTLYGPDGAVLFVFQFSDPANGRGPLEAAWRNPRRARGGDDLGVVDVVGRDGAALTLTFAPSVGAHMIRVDLQASPSGGFAGKIDDGAGAAQTVTLRR